MKQTNVIVNVCVHLPAFVSVLAFVVGPWADASMVARWPKNFVATLDFDYRNYLYAINVALNGLADAANRPVLHLVLVHLLQNKCTEFLG